jgi:hypothetical protein
MLLARRSDVKLGAIPENPLEGLALLSGMVPTPLGDTIVAMTLARTIMVAVKLNVFETLAYEQLTAREIAKKCSLDDHATEMLLYGLAGAGYVRVKQDKYSIAPVVRKWLLKSSHRSLYDYMLFNFLNWSWIERFEDFLRTGESIEVHQEMSDDECSIYQRAMLSIASFSADEVAKKLPISKSARAMLDIGGSHGLE